MPTGRRGHCWDAVWRVGRRSGAGELLRAGRVAKDEAEVEAIEAATATIHGAILEAFSRFGIGASELEIGAWLKNAMDRGG